MEYRNRGNNQQQASQNHHSSNYSYFAEQARGGAAHFSGYMDPQLGRVPSEFFIDHHHPHPNLNPHAHPQFPPHPHAVHEIIQREIEKQRIREEIIISEIARRRALEAEVRMELMMERELALQRGGDGFSFGSHPQMGFDRSNRLAITGTSFEERVLEERIETLPFQRRAVDLRVSEIKPVSEGGKEKVILLAKPSENISGSKRNASTPPGSDATETPLDEILKRKAKEEWSCALCKVNATCEQGLNEHLQGKRHKSKEIALRAQRAEKNYSIGLLPKKANKFSKAEDSVQFTSEPLVPQKKNEPELVEQVQKNDERNKKKHNFWCEICKVGTLNLKTMNIHKKGKKHARRVEEKNYSIGLLPKKATKFSKPEDSVQFTSETLAAQKKNEPELVEQVQKNDEQNKKKHNFWCEICKVGTLTLKTMNIHKKGKKHARRVEISNRNGGSHPNKIATLVNHSKCDDVDVSNVVYEHIDETSDETRVEVDVPENHEVVDECTAELDEMKEDRTAVDVAKPEDEPIDDVIESKDGD